MKTFDLNTARENSGLLCLSGKVSYGGFDEIEILGLIQEDIDLLIIELIQFNFLNEKRYARSFARGKFRIKKWGKLKIRMALKKRDIHFKYIDLAMLEIDDKTYLITLKELLRKKNDILKETNSYKRKMKLIRYLVNRGYEYDLIHDVLVDLKLY